MLTQDPIKYWEQRPETFTVKHLQLKTCEKFHQYNSCLQHLFSYENILYGGKPFILLTIETFFKSYNLKTFLWF